MTDIKKYRCLLVGNTKVGKTTFINKIITGKFNPNYIPTIGINVIPLFCQINKNNVIFNIIDIAGLENNRLLGDANFINADCAIIMMTKYSSNMIRKWRNKIEEYSPNIPIAIVINHFQNDKSINNTNYGNKQKIYLSIKNNWIVTEPFIYLFNQLDSQMKS